jgi:hypothetical protein
MIMEHIKQIKDNAIPILRKYDLEDLLSIYSDRDILALVAKHIKPNKVYTVEECVGELNEILAFDVSCFMDKQDIAALYNLFIEWSKKLSSSST